jgi:hypothetical protein
MNIIQEARYRLACCKARSGDGWGERNSLRNHMRCSIGPRIHGLRPFVMEIEGLPEDNGLRCERDTVDLMSEYQDLLNVQGEMIAYLELDPNGEKDGRTPQDEMVGMLRIAALALRELSRHSAFMGDAPEFNHGGIGYETIMALDKVVIKYAPKNPDDFRRQLERLGFPV